MRSPTVATIIEDIYDTVIMDEETIAEIIEDEFDNEDNPLTVDSICDKFSVKFDRMKNNKDQELQ